ncbi:hypothetical protein KPL44_24030 [Clostridium sp. DSM 17811]|uniref:hypothetical protein n=1 Tax=Clostridium sp. DSM 17811 TaxID=2843317 RepID=UPI001C0BB1FB|nr:hypothetical protein [Clostridium sp. DSM 17811]MBU3102311.1 hypothetical protein [Clostridium sp. DSM 17811]
MGYEPQLVDAKSRSFGNLVQSKLLNNEKILYYEKNMPIELPDKGGMFNSPEALFTSNGRVIAFLGGGLFGEDKCYIADSVVYSIRPLTKLRYDICINTTGYPRISSTISLKSFIEYSEKCKDPIKLGYNGYKIIENKKIGQVQILNEFIILEYYLSGNIFKNKIEYSYMEGFNYDELTEILVIRGIFKDLFSNFPNILTIKNIKKNEFLQILNNFNNNPNKGKLFANVDITKKNILLNARYLKTIDKSLKLDKENKLIANIVDDEIRFINYNSFEFLGSANIKDSIFIKYNDYDMLIYTDKYYFSVKDNNAWPTSWNDDGVPCMWENKSGIEYLLQDTYSTDKSQSSQKVEKVSSILEKNVLGFLNPRLQNTMKSLIHSVQQGNKIKNADIYKEYYISDLPDQIKSKIGLIVINDEVYPLKINLDKEWNLKVSVKSNNYDCCINITQDISTLEVINNICDGFYNIKIDTNSNSSSNLGLPIELYHDITIKFIQSKIKFDNLNSTYFEWSKTLRDIVVYYYFTLLSELKGYLENCFKNNVTVSDLCKDDKIKIINVMYDTLKQYKNANMQFSAYFCKELYEEHAKDNNTYFKQNFDQLQHQMLNISNQITRHINDCIANLNSLITYIYPELDIRKALEELNKKRAIVNTITYVGLAFLTQGVTLIAAATLNAKGIFETLDRGKLVDNMEEAKINIFLNNSINEFNMLMETLMPKYINDINDSILGFTRGIAKYYADNDIEFLNGCVINNKIFLETPIDTTIIKKKQVLIDCIIDKAVKHNTEFIKNNVNGLKKLSRAEYHQQLQGGK